MPARPPPPRRPPRTPRSGTTIHEYPRMSAGTGGSRNQNARPGGGAALQVLVRLADVLERVFLVDRDFHLAACHHVEQVVGDREQILAFGGISVERRARAEQRALLLQEV